MAMKRIAAMLLTSVLLLSCVGCAQDGRKEPGAEKADLGLTADVKPATDFTAKANAAVYDELDFDDKQEYEFATRGLIDAPETLELKDENGTILWSQEAYAFLDDYEKAPDSVNPSLWENTKNNHAYGLFEVTDGIYQVRGYDMANLTVVKGDTGWIVFDTLMSVECSQAAMQLIEKNLGKFPVKAVIISHSHADHFGGIAGVMAKEDKADETLSIEDQLASGKIPVITPVGFTEHSVKENVYAGKGMGRRSNYQYGILLTPGVTGKLAQGIGMGQSTGTVSFMTPSYEITQSGEKLTIDGVELEFQLTPGTVLCMTTASSWSRRMTASICLRSGWRKTAPARSTISTRCAARRCATARHGQAISPRPFPFTARTRRSPSSPTTGRTGETTW